MGPRLVLALDIRSPSLGSCFTPGASRWLEVRLKVEIEVWGAGMWGMWGVWRVGVGVGVGVQLRGLLSQEFE